ncbi:allantoinase AllB [Anoxynatronum sibiricum]|uniref:allantoinase n=1 Tax=Anoxynatronum sibiricum TaxID=210623 RepID=A0ABU9VYM0_9CLOT
MVDLMIKNGMIVSKESIYPGNIAVRNGIVCGIYSDKSELEATATLDAQGMLIFPGVIDCHVHLNEPGYTWREDYYHGTKAAAIGGTTTVIDMPLQNTPPLTDKASFEAKEKAVSANAFVDYCLWGGMIDNNIEKLEELRECGVVAFKAFLSPVSEGYTSMDTGLINEAFEKMKTHHVRMGFHCEDYSIIAKREAKLKNKNSCTWEDYLYTRPLVAEIIATQNIVSLAKAAKMKVHICHVSHPDVAQIIERAQLEGVDVTGETCPHYLMFSEDDLIEKGSLFKCAPPLRSKENANQLWEYLERGVISCVGSDHSPSTSDEKNETERGVMGVWGGISGMQHLLPIMYREAVVRRGFSPSLITKVLCEGPAKAFGIYGKKGDIALGFDADFVIFDPKKPWQVTEESLMYKNRLTAFLGQEGIGCPVKTILRGQVVMENDQVRIEQGYGKLIRRELSIAEATR